MLPAVSAGASERPSLRALTARARADVRSVGAEWRGGDRSSLWSLLGRVWSVVAGLLILALATTVLSPATQGYFFTFMGLMTAQTVLEVGFAAVLAQFSSHEWSALRAGEDGRVTGPTEARARLGSLIRLAQRWYLFVGVAVAVVLGLGGSLLLASQGDTGVAWVTPWWLLIGAQALVVQTLPLSGLLEGCDRVTSSQRSLLTANVLATSASALALALGAGLYALALAAGVRAVVALSLQLWHARDILALRHCRDPDHSIGWRGEFLPQQWRIGLSWMAGFAMFQSFTPIAFAVGGPVVAGTVGVAAQAFLITQGLGLAWVTASQPRFGTLAARGDVEGLRAIARQTLLRSGVTAALVAALGWGTAAAITVVAPDYGERFGGLLPLGIFLLCAVLLQISNVETSAVRFRKREPFVASSVAGAVLVVLSSAWLGSRYGATGIALGFLAVLALMLLPWVHVLYLRHTHDAP